jgi:hypothetical protein
LSIAAHIVVVCRFLNLNFIPSPPVVCVLSMLFVRAALARLTPYQQFHHRHSPLFHRAACGVLAAVTVAALP